MSIQKTITQSFQEMKSILSQFDDKLYQKELDIISNATIGQHFRHIIEFYDCVVDAQEKGTVCYDERKRNLLWENSVVESLSIINLLYHKIMLINLEKSLQLKQSYYGETFFINSSNKRELLYCFDHSVHHFALIKIALSNHFPSIKTPINFGVASSTVVHKNKVNES